MKIIEFRAENVKKLSLVEYKPDPKKGLVIVAGRNGQGKSSVLDAIEMTLGGKDHVCSRPIRKGQDEGSVELSIGDAKGRKYRVRRTFTAAGGSLTLWNADEVKQPSPQAILDDLFNQHTFDPMAFKNAKPTERTETLKQLLGLNFDAMEAEHAQVFDERTTVNRDVKANEAMIRSNPRHPDVPAEEQSTSAILEEEKQAGQKNASNRIARAAVESCKGQLNVLNSAVTSAVKRVDEITLEIEALQKKLVIAEGELEEREKKAGEGRAAVAAAQKAAEGLQDIDTAPFVKKLQDLEYTNLKVRKNKQIDGYVQALTECRRKADRLTSRLDAIDRKKKEMIAAAKFPVTGLGFNDANEVTFNDIPFDQVNTADQLRVSVAIGLVLNPQLRVMLIHQGNDLDEDNLRLVGEMADQADAQVWIERVSTDGDVSIILEDGHIKGSSEEAPAPATAPTAATAETSTPKTAEEPKLL